MIVVPRIHVVLAVYNGAQFLAQQIDSILQQTGVEVRLYCRDDGSTDQSLAILDTFAYREPERVMVLNPGSQLGVVGNFETLLTVAVNTADVGYIALADQDDLWHPDKLQHSYQQLRQRERLNPHQPILVHSDLRVIDSAGQLIAPSLRRYQRIPYRQQHFAHQLFRNTVTGCTVLMNAALVRKALPIPSAAIMHDWWLSLVASAFGQLGYIDRSLVDYRQHGANALGAQAQSRHHRILRVLGRMVRGQPMINNQAMICRLAQQARAFLTQFASELTVDQQRTLARIIDLPHHPWQQLAWRVWGGR